MILLEIQICHIPSFEVTHQLLRYEIYFPSNKFAAIKMKKMSNKVRYSYKPYILHSDKHLLIRRNNNLAHQPRLNLHVRKRQTPTNRRHPTRHNPIPIRTKAINHRS